jgi:hypothetical protein
VLGAGAMSALAPAAFAADPEIPPEGIAQGIKHLSYSDIGGRPDSVQVMVSNKHVYVGHMFSDGVTILDAADPRNLKPVGFFTAGQFTRTHHLQTSDNLMLLANGANIVAMQSYDTMRGYFENALADSITNRKKFRSGLSIHDISKPAEMREIAFLEMPGFGINRLWWPGGRYAYISAHFDGFTDHILCIVDLQNITKPEIVSRWWLPGMNRAAGEQPTMPKGKRAALHHMLTAGNYGYAAWRDGGLTIHDISDASNPKLVSKINWSPPFPGGTHTPLPTPRERDFCTIGTFGPHNLHENRPGSFQSEEIIFATYNTAGVRVFDIKDAFAPKEVAYWVPPVPKKLVDPRPNISLAAKTCDAYVTPEGLMYVSDWNAGMHVLQYEG